MIIHLVRHGDTQVGEDGLYIPNAGLTELGHRQAELAARQIHKLNPQAAFTSTLPRAIQTSDAYFRLSGRTADQIPELCELDTGNIWDAPEDIKTKIRNGGYDVNYKALGGESLDEFSNRVGAGFDRLLHTGSTSRIGSAAAFLHEGVIQTILDRLDGFAEYDNDRRGPMPNGAIVSIDTSLSAPFFPGKWETSHLNGI